MLKEDPAPLKNTFQRWENQRPSHEHVSTELAETIKLDCEELYKKMRKEGSGINVFIEAYVRDGWLLVPDSQAKPTDWHVSMDLKEPYKLKISTIHMSKQIIIPGGFSQERKNFSFLINQPGPITSYIHNGSHKPMTTQDYIDLRHITHLVKRKAVTKI